MTKRTESRARRRITRRNRSSPNGCASPSTPSTSGALRAGSSSSPRPRNGTEYGSAIGGCATPTICRANWQRNEVPEHDQRWKWGGNTHVTTRERQPDHDHMRSRRQHARWTARDLLNRRQHPHCPADPRIRCTCPESDRCPPRIGYAVALPAIQDGREPASMQLLASLTPNPIRRWPVVTCDRPAGLGCLEPTGLDRRCKSRSADSCFPVPTDRTPGRSLLPESAARLRYVER
jgi:hypothetical protein